MLRRPRSPGRHGSPSSQNLWLSIAFAIILINCLQLAEAKQPLHQQAHPLAPDDHQQETVGEDVRQHVNRGSQPVPGDGLVHNLAVTNLQDVDVTLETPPSVQVKGGSIHNGATHQQRQRQHQYQQQPLPNQRAFSNSRSKRPDSSHQQKGKQIANNNQHHNNKHIVIPNDASAVAILAPAQAVRDTNSPRYHRSDSSIQSTAGLYSPHVARSLEDWDIEDFVLLATVDGDLYASDRKTLKKRWHLEVDQPMVETKHYRTNSSALDEDYDPIDHYIWAVEPTRDGGLYVWMPDSDVGLVKTGFTMKRLVDDLAPYADTDPPVVYNGDKKTTLITLDAATGKVLKWFGSGGSHINEEEACLRPDGLYSMDPDECSSTGTITLGRTEYTVSIERRDGRPIATLKYSEWGPNNHDADLLHQYHASKDSRYFASHHDGNVYAFDQSAKPKTHEPFSAPVARVFDVCRPWDAPADSNPELVVLPQPPMPSRDEDIARLRSQRTFLNRTASGSWYAMSGRSYPLIIDAPAAQVSHPDSLGYGTAWETIDDGIFAKLLIGNHYVDSAPSTEYEAPPTLPPGNTEDQHYNDGDHDPRLPAFVSEDAYDLGFLDNLKSLPQMAINNIIALISNPVLIIVCMVALVMNESNLRRAYNRFKERAISGDSPWKLWKVDPASGDGAESDANAEDSTRGDVDREEPEKPTTTDKDGNNSLPTNESEPKEDAKVEENKEKELPLPLPESSGDSGEQGAGKPKTEDAAQIGDGENAINETPQKKKKAHRGRRGGVKHRKGKPEQSQSRDDDSPPKTVDEVVNFTERLGEEKRKLQPDVVTVTPNDMQGIGGPIVQLGNIEVNTDEQLGTGSNGTLVFAGKFDGRDVAVKRMLIHFYEIAIQETRLLKESDDHPNVIRYYSQQAQDGFLYIALERCAASLADVIEKPHAFRDLANAGRQDLPAVLYQITNGINHLHSLRIVHRDLKPQNILVNMGKDGRPRLLVSDFGLCKKLEGGQSSFGATTGRAAGTSGWRAPELLLDDDARDNGMIDTDTHSGSGSVLVADGLMPNSRRATRAIDIFSLGLVFYYVLTNGCHPFDCGDRYMREVNIRKGNFNLDMLDSLGDFSYEAKDLIASMLHADPKIRPLARDVLAHPFFWSAKKRLGFLCDVSDHFEKESRDPPSDPLLNLEGFAPEVTRGDFLKVLPREFVDSLGKQRKYTGSKMLDLLRALRNKRNHYEDMPDSLKRTVGPLPDGYLSFWTTKFPNLLIACWNIVYNVGWENTDRFKDYYEPAGL